MEEIQEESQEALDRVTKDDDRKCFQEWEKHWDKCTSQGDYFEGDWKGTSERFIMTFFQQFQAFLDPLLCIELSKTIGINILL